MLKITESNLEQVYPFRNLLFTFVTLNNIILKLVVPDHSDLLFSLQVMTSIMDSNFTQPIHLEIMQDGKLQQLEPTTSQPILS